MHLQKEILTSNQWDDCLRSRWSRSLGIKYRDEYAIQFFIERKIEFLHTNVMSNSSLITQGKTKQLLTASCLYSDLLETLTGIDIKTTLLNRWTTNQRKSLTWKIHSEESLLAKRFRQRLLAIDPLLHKSSAMSKVLKLILEACSSIQTRFRWRKLLTNARNSSKIEKYWFAAKTDWHLPHCVFVLRF